MPSLSLHRRFRQSDSSIDRREIVIALFLSATVFRSPRKIGLPFECYDSVPNSCVKLHASKSTVGVTNENPATSETRLCSTGPWSRQTNESRAEEAGTRAVATRENETGRVRAGCSARATSEDQWYSVMVCAIFFTFFFSGVYSFD